MNTSQASGSSKSCLKQEQKKQQKEEKEKDFSCETG